MFAFPIYYDQEFLSGIIVEGRSIDFSDSIKAQQQILISDYTASRMKLKVGDDFLMYFVQEPLRKRKFEIVGIYNLGVEEIDKTYVIGDLSIIQRLNNWEKGAVGGYEIKIDDFRNLRSEEHTSELQSLMRISYAVFCLKKKKKNEQAR